MGELPPDPSRGIACIGVVPLVVNFNMRFRPQDPKEKVALITQAVRERNLVQALTLEHEDGCREVACNLLNVAERSPEQVLEIALRKCRELDVEVVTSYTTGPTEKELLARIS